MIAAPRPVGFLVTTRAAIVLALIWTTFAAADRLAAQAVAGQVVDALTGDGVGQASVHAVGSDGATRPPVVTDSTGHFLLPLDPGSYHFRVEHLGYRPLETGEVELGRGEVVTVEIRLGPLPLEMEPLVVRARGRDGMGNATFYQRMERQRAVGQGRFITREEIERDRVMNLNDLLVRQPGLRLVRVRASDVIVMTGRGRNCLPALYFDGMPVSQDVSEVDLSNWFQPDMIEGIEIYTSALATPAELRSNGCGAIAIWSRSDAGDGRPFTLRRLLMAGGFVGLFLLLRMF